MSCVSMLPAGQLNGAASGNWEPPWQRIVSTRTSPAAHPPSVAGVVAVEDAVAVDDAVAVEAVVCPPPLVVVSAWLELPREAASGTLSALVDEPQAARARRSANARCIGPCYAQLARSATVPSRRPVGISIVSQPGRVVAPTLRRWSAGRRTRHRRPQYAERSVDGAHTGSASLPASTHSASAHCWSCPVPHEPCSSTCDWHVNIPASEGPQYKAGPFVPPDSAHAVPPPTYTQSVELTRSKHGEPSPTSGMHVPPPSGTSGTPSVMPWIGPQ